MRAFNVVSGLCLAIILGAALSVPVLTPSQASAQAPPPVFIVTPEGSLIMGGTSRNSPQTPATDDYQQAQVTGEEYDSAAEWQRRRWISDFAFERSQNVNEGAPRLHTRALILFSRGDSPDIQMGRTGPDQAPTLYGPITDTEPGVTLGKLIWTMWGAGQFQGDVASIHARGDTWATNVENPGSLHFATAGENRLSQIIPAGDGTENTPVSPYQKGFRDAVQRLMIASNGNVAIGDDFYDPQARLHIWDMNPTLRMTATTSNQAPQIELYENNTLSWSIDATRAGGPLYFRSYQHQGDPPVTFHDSGDYRLEARGVIKVDGCDGCDTNPYALRQEIDDLRAELATVRAELASLGLVAGR